MKWAYILVVAPGYSKVEVATLLTFAPEAILPFELPRNASDVLVFFPVSALKVVVGTTDVPEKPGFKRRKKLQTAHSNRRKRPPKRQHGSAEVSCRGPVLESAGLIVARP